jgi:hypothetical protein
MSASCGSSPAVLVSAVRVKQVEAATTLNGRAAA